MQMITNKKILLVEDNLTIQGFHAYLLSRFQCDVDMATTGQDAFTLFRNNTYHAILMDVGLPGMSGVDVTRKIREYETCTQKTMSPIIVITAYDTKEIRLQCENLQVQAVMSKPLKLKHLQQILSACGVEISISYA
jgi:two-component system aerobic respiration control sensor histidine kinase ArcB